MLGGSNSTGSTMSSSPHKRPTSEASTEPASPVGPPPSPKVTASPITPPLSPSPPGTPASPFTSWATAATNIATAVGAAVAFDAAADDFGELSVELEAPPEAEYCRARVRLTSPESAVYLDRVIFEIVP